MSNMMESHSDRVIKASDDHKEIRKNITVRRLTCKVNKWEIQPITLTPANILNFLAEHKKESYDVIARHWDSLDAEGQRKLFDEIANSVGDVEDDENYEEEDEDEDAEQDMTINHYIDEDDSGYGDRFTQDLSDTIDDITKRVKTEEERLRDEHAAIVEKSSKDIAWLDEKIEWAMKRFRKEVEDLRREANLTRQKENKRLDEINQALLALKTKEIVGEPVQQATLEDLMTGRA